MLGSSNTTLSTSFTHTQSAIASEGTQAGTWLSNLNAKHHVAVPVLVIVIYVKGIKGNVVDARFTRGRPVDIPTRLLSSILSILAHKLNEA